MLSKHPIKYKHTVKTEVHDGNEYVVVEIFHPKDAEKNIEISTYGRELTLFIWQHHEHHDSYEEDNHEEEYTGLCEYIDDIINDKVFFFVRYRNGEVAGGGAAYEIKDIIDSESCKIEIKSWSGVHDKLITGKG